MRAAIVPDHEIADPPFMAVDETRLGRKGKQLVQQRPALVKRPADDMRRMRGDEQGVAPGARMPPHQRMLRRRPRRAFLVGRHISAALAARMPDRMFGDEAFELFFHRLRQRVVGGARVGEICIAARLAARPARAAATSLPTSAGMNCRCATARWPGCTASARRRRRAGCCRSHRDWTRRRFPAACTRVPDDAGLALMLDRGCIFQRTVEPRKRHLPLVIEILLQAARRRHSHSSHARWHAHLAIDVAAQIDSPDSAAKSGCSCLMARSMTYFLRRVARAYCCIYSSLAARENRHGRATIAAALTRCGTAFNPLPARGCR